MSTPTVKSNFAVPDRRRVPDDVFNRVVIRKLTDVERAERQFAVLLNSPTQHFLEILPHLFVERCRFLRRLAEIERLPRRDQAALLRTIDAFLSKVG